MTRIVLILTAVPLAAILALVLNTLLERATEKPRVVKSLAFLVSGALLLALGAAAPAAARAPAPAELCGSLECSLEVDRQQLDEFWSRHQPKKVRLLYQSRIPVTEESLRDNNASEIVDERGRRRPRKVSNDEVGKATLETIRR